MQCCGQLFFFSARLAFFYGAALCRRMEACLHPETALIGVFLALAGLATEIHAAWASGGVSMDGSMDGSSSSENTLMSGTLTNGTVTYFFNILSRLQCRDFFFVKIDFNFVITIS